MPTTVNNLRDIIIINLIVYATKRQGYTNHRNKANQKQTCSQTKGVNLFEVILSL